MYHIAAKPEELLQKKNDMMILSHTRTNNLASSQILVLEKNVRILNIIKILKQYNN